MPGSGLKIYRGVGHFPHCDQPDRFVDDLLAFIDKTVPAQTDIDGWQDLIRTATARGSRRPKVRGGRELNPPSPAVQTSSFGGGISARRRCWLSWTGAGPRPRRTEMDLDGYGYKPDEKGPARLLEDLRTLSPLGIARAAGGWSKHVEEGNPERFHGAEKAALKALEEANLAPLWEGLRRQLLDLTEGRTSLVAWRAEHGDTGHKAENAVLGAALGVLARDHIDGKDYRVLVNAAAEEFPWLLAD